jgi:hypothetical protein
MQALTTKEANKISAPRRRHDFFIRLSYICKAIKLDGNARFLSRPAILTIPLVSIIDRKALNRNR